MRRPPLPPFATLLLKGEKWGVQWSEQEVSGGIVGGDALGPGAPSFTRGLGRLGVGRGRG